MRWRRGRAGVNARRAVAGSLLVAAGLVLVGCDTTSDMAIPRPGSTFGGPSDVQAGSEPSTPSSSAPAADPTPDAAGTCPDGLWATIKDGIDDPSVALVGLVDGCRAARIETTLDRGNVAVGMAICRKAAAIAFQRGVTSITVTASDASTLAGAATDAGCIAAP